MTNDIEFTSRVRKAALISAQIKLLEQEKKELLSELGELDFRDYPAGDYILRVQHNWALNKAAVKKTLKPGQLKLVEKTDIDPAKVRTLFPEVYEANMKDYENPRKYIIEEVKDV